MKIQRRKSNRWGLNMTSTADISFMLLVFFLVTTSMYIDKGLPRRLPPKDKKPPKEVSIDRENIISVRLAADGALSVNDSLCPEGELKSRLAEFIMRCGKEHVVMIDADENCRYEAYFHVQNALGEAYREVREAAAMKRYGRSLDQLTSIDLEALLCDYPQRVAENLHEKATSNEQEGREE